jgi:hypothetical protein
MYKNFGVVVPALPVPTSVFCSKSMLVALPPDAFPILRVAVPLGVSMVGVCIEVPAIPVPDILKFPVCWVPGVVLCSWTPLPVVSRV